MGHCYKSDHCTFGYHYRHIEQFDTFLGYPLTCIGGYSQIGVRRTGGISRLQMFSRKQPGVHQEASALLDGGIKGAHVGALG